jgi:hypothetical protein
MLFLFKNLDLISVPSVLRCANQLSHVAFHLKAEDWSPLLVRKQPEAQYDEHVCHCRNH